MPKNEVEKSQFLHKKHILDFQKPYFATFIEKCAVCILFFLGVLWHVASIARP